MRRMQMKAVAAALALATTLGCYQSPNSTPVKTRAMKGGDVDMGPNSLEATRRRLQGTWELTSLEVFSPSGQPLAAQAIGRLQYDEFGNLSMQGKITGGPDVDSSVLNVTGRVAIDPVAHTLRFQDVTSRTAEQPRVDPQLDAGLVRYYEFVGDMLKTTVKAADGRTTATATWKRVD